MSPSGGSGNGRKVVGIYDRPASADRPKRPLQVVAVLVIVAVVALFFYLR